ncbi:MAG: response regulator [Anaerolineae bacterium]|nr:response regulator [Anaerolineales bacterium]MCQ3978930.1 response regulator [Anaerolineae bacterium]
MILLVEDNPDHAELVRRSFQNHELANQIYHVADGEAALDYLLQQNFPRPHLILLDLRLPKIDGLEVLRQIKTNEELRRIPVVILTTSKAQGDLAGAYNNHVNSYLVKPVSFDKFTRLMDDLSHYWLGWNRQPSRE